MGYAVGTKVKIINLESGDPKCLFIGLTGTVLDDSSAPYIVFDIDENDALHDCDGLIDRNNGYALTEDQVEPL